MITVKERIIIKLKTVDRALAIHEFNLLGVSENALAARLRELTQDGQLCRATRAGKRFKEWALEPSQLELIR